MLTCFAWDDSSSCSRSGCPSSVLTCFAACSTSNSSIDGTGGATACIATPVTNKPAAVISATSATDVAIDDSVPRLGVTYISVPAGSDAAASSTSVVAAAAARSASLVVSTCLASVASSSASVRSASKVCMASRSAVTTNSGSISSAKSGAPRWLSRASASRSCEHSSSRSPCTSLWFASRRGGEATRSSSARCSCCIRAVSSDARASCAIACTSRSTSVRSAVTCSASTRKASA